jgi:hypothetical protein
MVRGGRFDTDLFSEIRSFLHAGSSITDWLCREMNAKRWHAPIELDLIMITPEPRKENLIYSAERKSTKLKFGISSRMWSHSIVSPFKQLSALRSGPCSNTPVVRDIPKH